MVKESEQCHLQYEKEHQNSRNQHYKTEHATQISREGDITKAERAHHRERPVKPGEPRMLLPLIDHEHVEEHAEHDHHKQQQGGILQQCECILADRSVAEKISELGGEEFHSLNVVLLSVARRPHDQ